MLVAHIPVYWYWYTQLPVPPCSIIRHRTCRYRPGERYIRMLYTGQGLLWDIRWFRLLLKRLYFYHMHLFSFGRTVTFQSLYGFRRYVTWNILLFPMKYANCFTYAYPDKLNLISVLDFYYFVLKILPKDGTLVLKHVRSLILVVNRIFLSAFVGWCTGCKDMQLYD